jgi:hypothetical protein
MLRFAGASAPAATSSCRTSAGGSRPRRAARSHLAEGGRAGGVSSERRGPARAAWQRSNGRAPALNSPRRPPRTQSAGRAAPRKGPAHRSSRVMPVQGPYLLQAGAREGGVGSGWQKRARRPRIAKHRSPFRPLTGLRRHVLAHPPPSHPPHHTLPPPRKVELPQQALVGGDALCGGRDGASLRGCSEQRAASSGQSRALSSRRPCATGSSPASMPVYSCATTGSGAWTAEGAGLPRASFPRSTFFFCCLKYAVTVDMVDAPCGRLRRGRTKRKWGVGALRVLLCCPDLQPAPSPPTLCPPTTSSLQRLPRRNVFGLQGGAAAEGGRHASCGGSEALPSRWVHTIEPPSPLTTSREAAGAQRAATGRALVGGARNRGAARGSETLPKRSRARGPAGPARSVQGVEVVGVCQRRLRLCGGHRLLLLERRERRRGRRERRALGRALLLGLWGRAAARCCGGRGVVLLSWGRQGVGERRQAASVGAPSRQPKRPPPARGGPRRARARRRAPTSSSGGGAASSPCCRFCWRLLCSAQRSFTCRTLGAPSQVPNLAEGERGRAGGRGAFGGRAERCGKRANVQAPAGARAAAERPHHRDRWACARRREQRGVGWAPAARPHLYMGSLCRVRIHAALTSSFLSRSPIPR